jgi:hypothetical protein
MIQTLQALDGETGHPKGGNPVFGRDETDAASVVLGSDL